MKARLVAGVVTLCLIVTVVQCLSLLGASFLNRQVQQKLDQGGIIHPDDRALALEQLQLARQIDQDNPETLLTMAYLTQNAEQRLHLFELLAHFRPVSARAWAEVFRTRITLKRFDQETTESLEKAIALGGWEPDVQLAILDAGTRGWVSISASDKENVLKIARRRLSSAALWQRGQAIDLLKKRGFLNIACSDIEMDPVPRECVSQG